jgi:hypothetical protein
MMLLAAENDIRRRGARSVNQGRSKRFMVPRIWGFFLAADR